MGRYDDLIWKTTEKEQILHTPVFDVYLQKEETASGMKDNLTLEFPGGVMDPKEEAKVTALRELEEETGYRAGKMTFLGRVSSNTALFKNHFSVFLAEDLVQTGQQHLDDDELLRFEEIPIEEVIKRYGDHELTHAYMGTALAFYFRQKMMS